VEYFGVEFTLIFIAEYDTIMNYFYYQNTIIAQSLKIVAGMLIVCRNTRTK